MLSPEKHLSKIYKVSWGRLEGQLCVLALPGPVSQVEENIIGNRNRLSG